MAEEITISKKSLWKYATFVLLAVVAVGGILLLSGNNPTGGAVSGNADLTPFMSDSSLYPSIGPDDAPNVIIEFSDFQCPYCTLASGLPSWKSQYQSQYSDLIGVAQKAEDLANQGKVKFIYVSMSFLGQESVYAAEAALCANEQGKFWEMHDAILKASDGPSENTGKYSKANLETIANGVSGLDTAKFNSCLESDRTLGEVQTIASQAKAAGVTGTPTFYVNGVKMSASWSQISAALK
jgi:protein-disulfide isomerase